MDGYVKIGFPPDDKPVDPSVAKALSDRLGLVTEMFQDFTNIMERAGIVVLMQVVGVEECKDGVAVVFSRNVRPDQATALLDRLSKGAAALRSKFGEVTAK